TKANVVAVAPHAEEMIVISEAADNQVVLGNREKLIQAFFNLVQNAVQHSPEKSMVNVTVDSDIENVKIGICDHGSGIPSQHLERVFQPFFTLRKDGIGLGLSITKAILDSHSGTIRVFNNTPSPGCTFEVLLPSHRESQT